MSTIEYEFFVKIYQRDEYITTIVIRYNIAPYWFNDINNIKIDSDKLYEKDKKLLLFELI